MHQYERDIKEWVAVARCAEHEIEQAHECASPDRNANTVAIPIARLLVQSAQYQQILETPELARKRREIDLLALFHFRIGGGGGGGARDNLHHYWQ